MILALKAGATEPYHIAPRRQIMFCLRGIVEVTAGDGATAFPQPAPSGRPGTPSSRWTPKERRAIAIWV